MLTLAKTGGRNWRLARLGFHLSVSAVVIVLSLMLLIYPAVTICLVVMDSQLNQTGECRLVPMWFKSAAGQILVVGEHLPGDQLCRIARSR